MNRALHGFPHADMAVIPAKAEIQCHFLVGIVSRRARRNVPLLFRYLFTPSQKMYELRPFRASLTLALSQGEREMNR